MQVCCMMHLLTRIKLSQSSIHRQAYLGFTYDAKLANPPITTQNRGHQDLPKNSTSALRARLPSGRSSLSLIVPVLIPKQTDQAACQMHSEPLLVPLNRVSHAACRYLPQTSEYSDSVLNWTDSCIRGETPVTIHHPLHHVLAVSYTCVMSLLAVGQFDLILLPEVSQFALLTLQLLCPNNFVVSVAVYISTLGTIASAAYFKVRVVYGRRCRIAAPTSNGHFGRFHNANGPGQYRPVRHCRYNGSSFSACPLASSTTFNLL